MKNPVSFLFCIVACTAVGAMVTHATIVPRSDPPREPVAAREDATLMRPAIRIDTSGGKVRIHGALAVLRPVSSGRDHAVTIRLSIIRPEDGKELYAEDLAKINYHRAHGRKDYQVNKELNFDAAGLDVKVAAVNAGDDVFAAGHEFASVVVHAPGPRKGE